MKPYILLPFFLVPATLTSAQVVVQNSMNNAYAIEAYDLKGKPFMNRAPEIEGTPYCTEKWGKGQVFFENGSRADGVELNFSQVDNCPVFKRDEAVYNFVNPVREIRFRPGNEATVPELVFRSGYPAIGKLTNAAFFRVVNDGGKYQLIEFASKKVGDVFLHVGKSEKVYQEEKALYIFDVANKGLIPVPKGKKDWQAFAESAPAPIRAYLDAHRKFNPKNEADFVGMIASLNQ